MNRAYENKELEKVVNIAKSIGLKVWTFESNGTIKSVFFDNGKTFGTASAYYGGIRYGTCHKACQSCGTGFSLGSDMDVADENRIMDTLQHAPNWAWTMAKGIIKESFEKHMKRDKVLSWYEI